jgi:hypothetical protein
MAGTIHVLSRADYSENHLVSLPLEDLAPLGPSSLRFRSRILGLTTNNLTYARLGHLLGWWDIHPLPPNTPAPYNDASKYGRISAWGYAEIVESTVPEVAVGQTLFGYLPISTAITTVRIEVDKSIGNDQIVVLDEYRQHLWKVYNRYTVREPLAELEKCYNGFDLLGWDSLMLVLYQTSFCMNRYAFAWEPQNLIHPSGAGEWSAEDADLRNATVVILNASGKTGLAFAHALRRDRPGEHQPRKIVGVGSLASVDVIKKSGLYDAVVLNDEHEATIKDAGSGRVVLLEFGARGGAVGSWVGALQAANVLFTFIVIGGEVKPVHPDETTKSFSSMAGLTVVNASFLREKGIEVGGEKYFQEFDAAWDGFKNDVKGTELEWAEGLEAWKEGWDRLCRDEVRPNKGLVYKI